MNYNPNPNTVRNPPGPGRKIKRVSDVNAMGPTAPIAAPSPYMQPVTAPAIDPVMSSVSYGGGVGFVGGFNNGSVPLQQPIAPQNYGYGQQPTSIPQQQQFQPQLQQHPQLQHQQQPQLQQQQQPQLKQQQQQQHHPQLQQQQHIYSTAPTGAAQMQFGATPPVGAAPNQFPNAIPPNFTMFQQPIVQDMAMQYGQRLADQGKQMVENQFEKYVPVAKLKYYFAVDNNYVINKMRLLFFPFTHKDWSLKYDQENPVQPRYDINAPDLYIPTMAYITYVVVAGLMLGMQQQFSPEQLGIQASSALAYSIFELVVYSITLYVVNIKTNLKTLDLLAFSGYKFVIIVAALLASTLFHGVGYYVMLIYSSLALGFFLLRTLKTKVLHDSTPTANTGAINYDPYGNPQQLDYTGGRKRKLYFLFLIVGGQAFLSFLLSKHLYFPDVATIEANKMQF